MKPKNNEECLKEAHARWEQNIVCTLSDIHKRIVELERRIDKHQNEKAEVAHPK